MPSSKGNPTDPELREEVKEEVKAEEKGETMASYPTPNVQRNPSLFLLLSRPPKPSPSTTLNTQQACLF
jgi:hypothetical protein